MQNEPYGYQYHRLLRGIPNYRWWKPLVLALLTVIFGFTLMVAAMGIIMVPMILSGGLNSIEAFELRILMMDTQDPLAIALSLVSLAVWIPAIILAAWSVGIKPVGRLWSVRFRMRWGLLASTFGWSLVVIAATQLPVMLYELFSTGTGIAFGEAAVPGYRVQPALISLLLILLLVPLQAAAEEMIFRGVFMQMLGSWFKNPVIPILVPSICFAMAHIYDIWGLLQVGLMGVTCAWLTWRTGGLEAAISLHIVNNLWVFLLLNSGVLGATSQAMTQSDGPAFISVIIQAVMLGLYALIVVKRFDAKRRREFAARPVAGVIA